MVRKRKGEELAPEDIPAPPRSAPLIFLSHDSRDGDLAEAFENLLTDASGGVLKAFRSSDRKGTSGIEFGAEWYATITRKLGEASDVVALVTANSLGRPWILYEVGVARGRIGTPAFGIAFGVSLDQVTGPFTQFQNSTDDEDSLTKLVLQLIRRNPDATPREEAVRRQVMAFRERTPLPAASSASNTDRTSDAVGIAKLFEEVKVMFRELPESVVERLTGQGIAEDTGWFGRHIYTELISLVDHGLRSAAMKAIREGFPDLNAAVRAGVAPPSITAKGFERLTLGELRDILL